MSKAEERAKERYWLDPNNVETQEKYAAYIEGYRQAEKDLELTWEDISAIRHTMARIRRQFSNDNQVVNNEEFCKERRNRYGRNIYNPSDRMLRSVRRSDVLCIQER